MKTIKILLASLVLISAATNLVAQQKQSTDANSIIKGILTENSDTMKVGFANVVIYRQKDSTIVTWTITKEDGSFEFTKVPSGPSIALTI